MSREASSGVDFVDAGANSLEAHAGDGDTDGKGDDGDYGQGALSGLSTVLLNCWFLVCLWSSNGWPMVGQWLANLMVGRLLANDWPMVG